MIVLAGDVGGTHARLALVDIDERNARVLAEANYPSPTFAGLSPIIELFLEQVDIRPERACFGVPGAVIEGRCYTPNLAWTIDTGDLVAATGIRSIQLINDFTAVGYGIGRLRDDDLVTLRRGEPRRFGQQVLIGAGTGMGVAIRTHDGRRWHVVACEGGHAFFGPRSEIEWRLAEWLRQKYQHASWERVVSGPGLVNIYRFLASTGVPESDDVRERMLVDDQAAVIARSAMARTDALSARALDMFISCYGAAAGMYGVIGVATGGVFLAGGIAPKLLDRLADGAFIEAFNGTGTHRQVAAQLPVHVILKPDAGVIGAAVAALEMDLD